MKEVQYSYTKAFPADFAPIRDEITTIVSDEAYALAERINDEYGCGIGEICAIIERVKEQQDILREGKNRHKFSKRIEGDTSAKAIDLPDGSTGIFNSSDTAIKSITIRTETESFTITDDPFLFDLIKKRYTPSTNWDASFKDILNIIYHYLTFSTKLGPTQQNVVAGMIAQHCELYPKNTPLLNEAEFKAANLEAETYKTYLHQTVKSWR